MATAGTQHSKRTVLADPRTGREVWKVTSWDEADCLATYMYLQAFSADERFLIFASNRSGKWELYRLELATGEAVQLSRRHTPPDPVVSDDYAHIVGHVHLARNEVFYLDGPRLVAAHLETLAERVVLDCRGSPWRILGGFPSFTPDGARFTIIYVGRDGREGIALAAVDGSGWEPLYQCAEPSQVLSHVLVVPTEPLSVTFNLLPDRQDNPSLPRGRRARAWRWTHGAAEPFLVVPPGFRATHEYWGRTPEPRLFYHRKSVPGWTPTWIESFAVDGGERIEHVGSSDRRLGHSCISPAGLTIITVVQDPKGNELVRIDLATGRSEVLCWPNSSCTGDQMTHVHPSFSPSGRMVAYTSDCGGRNAVYIVPLNERLRR